MRTRILLALLLIGTVLAAGFAARKDDPYSSAKDLPRGALVYVQVTDLPKLLKDLRGSEAAAKYMASHNFADFQNNHLGRKLAARWQEFNDGAGFPFDLETISGFAEARAAVGIYDIGKLEFVFTAPVSDELFTATMFMQKSDRFESEELPGRITVYRAAIDADRGRQKQELLFANVKGRLIVATAEKLLVRTIDNITGTSRRDRLADDPRFRRLRDTLKPHLFTVWLNQTALNSNYYFKRYWLMGDVKDLRNYEAGMFDFSIEKDQIIEDRQFLVKGGTGTRNISSRRLQAALTHLPESVPYYRFRSAAPAIISDAIRTTIDLDKNEKPAVSKRPNFTYSPDDYEYEDYGYDQLGSKFDTAINEVPDERPAASPPDERDEIAPLLLAAAPESVLTFARPEMRPAPFFAEFRRGAIFQLAAPAGLDRGQFEKVISQAFLRRVTIASTAKDAGWTTKSENGATWRQFDLPMLGWSVCYAVRGNELFLAGDAAFLGEMFKNKKADSDQNAGVPISERVVLDVPETARVFDSLFGKLAAGKLSEDFFTGNIKSLFESIPDIKRIEFERGSSGDLMHEKVVIRR